MNKTLLLLVFLALNVFSFAQPTITSFTPASGAAPSWVVITGTGFNTTASNNKVYVGGVAATVSSATATQLVIMIPTAASSKSRIRVINTSTNLSCISRAEFIRTFSGGIATSANINTQFISSANMTGPDLTGESYGTLLGLKSVSGDFDNDGKIDYAAMGKRTANSLTVYQNTTATGASLSSSGFTSALTLTLDVNSTGVYPYAEDINGDGLLDILVSRSNGFTVFINTSSGPGVFSFTKSTYSPTGTYYSRKTVLTDFDKDGLPDIAAINPGSAGVSYYKNTSSAGTVNFNIVPVNTTPGETVGDIIAADLDNDGDNDVVVSGMNGSVNQALYYNLNTNTVSGTMSISSTFTAIYSLLPKGTYTGPVGLASADFDGDGDLDLVSVTKGGSGTTGGWVYIHKNNGSLNFSSFYTGNYTGVSNISFCVRTADLNGDGKIDIVVSDQNSGSLYAILNKYVSGTMAGTDFANSTAFPNSITAETICVDDFNQDGKVDLISSNFFSSTLTLYTNTIVTYYPKSGGASALQILTNWSATTDGTGSAPANFGSSNNFVLANSSGTTSFAISGALTMSGSLSIPSGATMAIGTNNFVLNGNLSNSGTISASSGTITVSGGSGQTIEGTGTYGNLIINNSNGIALSANTIVTGALTLTSGIVNIGANAFTFGTTSGASATSYLKTSSSGSVKSNIANTVSRAFPVGNSAYNPVTITNNTGSADDFSVKVLDEVYLNGSNGTVVTAIRVRRTWDITKTTANAGSGVNLVFNWNIGETSATLVTPAMYHYGSYWSQQTGTTSSGANTLTYTGYTGTFSPFAVSDANSTLPVTWLGFSAQKKNNSVVLNWSTSTEQNTSDYTIQHSTDALSWTSEGTVSAAGNSSQTQQYTFTHDHPAAGNNYYRILQKDRDDRQSFSKTVYISFAAVYKQLSVYPNPAVNGQLQVQLEKAGTVQIFNSLGKLMLQKTLTAGVHQLSVPQLTKGLYLVKSGGETVTVAVQ